MASGGGVNRGRTPNPQSHQNKSWAKVVSGESTEKVFGSEIVNSREYHDKLKTLNHPRFKPDADFRLRIHDRMKNVLYGKFLGRGLPLDQLRSTLAELWKDYGCCTISDMPNGFYYIRCQSLEMAEKLMWEGPWTVSGMVLQLIPWRENFQPAFEKLETAAIWVEFHHLPMEFWDSDHLESLGSLLGNVLRIDDHTLNVDTFVECNGRAKYARLCIEIDLSKPLQRGIWVGEGDDEKLVMVLYEKLPSFCFRCGCIGHIAASCQMNPSSHPTEKDKVSSPAAGREERIQPMHVDGSNEELPPKINHNIQNEIKEVEESRKFEEDGFKWVTS